MVRSFRVLRLAVAVAAVAMGGAVWALDGTSRLSGAVNGQAETWHVVTVGGASGGYWSDMGTLHQVGVMAFSDPDGQRIDGAVEFSLTLDSRSDPMGVLDATVTWYGDDLRHPYSVPPAHGHSVEVEIDRSRVEGDRIYLRGRLSAPLLRMLDADTESFDETDSVEFDLDFDVAVERL